MSVAVLGALHLDVVVEAGQLPRLDETLIGRSVAYRVGGKGANQAIAAARMGAATTMTGAVGDDAFGPRLRAGLAAAGVAHAAVRTLPGASGMSVAIVDDDGAYGAVVVSGVNADLTDAMVEVPVGTGVLSLQNEVPTPVNVAAARMARAMGATVVLNAAPARPLGEMETLTDILIVNRLEAADMTGAATPEAAAACLRKRIPTVIVTLGADGLILCGRETVRMPAVTVEARSSHGAGDMFVGAFAAEYSRTTDIGGAVEFARRAAACFVATDPEARGTLTRAQVQSIR